MGPRRISFWSGKWTKSGPFCKKVIQVNDQNFYVLDFRNGNESDLIKLRNALPPELFGEIIPTTSENKLNYSGH